jgi:hypothetical protein
MKRSAVRYIYVLLVLMFTGFFISGCGGDGSTGHWDGGDGTSDSLAPTVTTTIPVDAATAVAIGNSLAATFSEAMDPLTITDQSFTLTDGVNPVTGAVSYTGVTASFNPTVDLDPVTVYTATISTVAADLAGNPLVSDYVWSFTTGAAPDTIVPTVTSTVPADAATAVAIGNNLTATFSEAMDPLTITNVSFTLADASAADVPGSVTYTGFNAVFNPTNNLDLDSTYTATISTVAADLAGNPLVSDYVWSFTTGAAPDTIVPTVTSTVPADAATAVALGNNLTATFSEAMDPLTITNVSFTLADALAVDVPGSVTYTGVTASFNPTVDLDPVTVYTATISTVAADLAGNPLASDYVWSFTTGAAPDIIAPTVTITSPDDLDTDVIVNKTLTATFSEAMDPLTITNVSFTLADALAVNVPGSVTYTGFNAVFNPTNDLDLDSTYTATISTVAADLAGNPLASDYVWSFTTVSEVGVGPLPVDLGLAENFAVLTKTGITTTGVTTITGNIGVSPIDATAITGFGLIMDSTNEFATSPSVTGVVYAADYAEPTPTNLTTAISDLHTAYVDAAGRTVPAAVTEEGAGNISGMTLAPGLYKWSTGVLVDPSTTVTLDGGANDVWIFQIAQDLTLSSAASIALSGGAQAKNVFWQVGGLTGVTLEPGSHLEGIILAAKGIEVKDGATVHGRLLGETNVTLISNAITQP